MSDGIRNDRSPSFRQSAVTQSRWFGLFVAIGILVVVLMAYSNAFVGPYVFDDVDAIRDNPTIQRGTDLAAILSPPARTTVASRPLLNASFALSRAMGGGSVLGHHAVNIAIHAASALVLFGLIRRTVNQISPRAAEEFGWIAPAVALVWALHPVQTEAVTYLVQRAESLMALFYLLTLYCVVAAIDGSKRGAMSRGWFVGAVVACAAGMATKEVMVSAPLVAVLYDRTFLATSFGEIWRRRGRWYLGLFSTWLILFGLIAIGGGNRGGSIGFGVGVGWWAHALTQFQAVSRYLWLAFWPHPLVFEYEPQWAEAIWAVLPYIVIVATAAFGTLDGLRRNSLVGLCGVLFFFVLAPTSLMPAPTQLTVEHRVYLPLVAVVVLALLGAYRLIGRRALVVAMACAMPFGFLTYARNFVYRTEIGLWTDTIAKRPENGFAHASLGAALTRTGRLTEALFECREAVRLVPDRALFHYNYGKALELSADPAAEQEYAAAVRLEPTFTAAHTNYAALLARRGRVEDARREFETAVRLNPKEPMGHYNLAALLADSGHLSESLPEFEAAVNLRPTFVEALTRWGATLALLQRVPEAMEKFDAALRADPANVSARNKQGLVYLMIGRVPEAVGCFEQALRIAPEDPQSNANLAMARRKLGQ